MPKRSQNSDPNSHKPTKQSPRNRPERLEILNKETTQSSSNSSNSINYNKLQKITNNTNLDTPSLKKVVSPAWNLLNANFDMDKAKLLDEHSENLFGGNKTTKQGTPESGIITGNEKRFKTDKNALINEENHKENRTKSDEENNLVIDESNQASANSPISIKVNQNQNTNNQSDNENDTSCMTSSIRDILTSTRNNTINNNNTKDQLAITPRLNLTDTSNLLPNQPIFQNLQTPTPGLNGLNTPTIHGKRYSKDDTNLLLSDNNALFSASLLNSITTDGRHHDLSALLARQESLGRENSSSNHPIFVFPESIKLENNLTSKNNNNENNNISLNNQPAELNNNNNNTSSTLSTAASRRFGKTAESPHFNSILKDLKDLPDNQVKASNIPISKDIENRVRWIGFF